MKKSYFILLFFICNSIYSQFNYQRDWASYYGGNGTKTIDGAVDSQGNIYITGDVYGSVPYSNSFVTANAQQASYGGGTTDVFIAKYDSTGILLWATYLGGSGNDNSYAITLDNADNLYIAGYTTSTGNIATSTGFQTTFTGSGSAFITKFSAAGILQWGTYYLDSTSGINDISADNNRNIIICGYTTSTTGITTPNSFQQTYTGTSPIISYLAQFNESGQRIWSTYYSPNSSSLSLIDAVCINSTGIYVKGNTYDSSGYYATTGCQQPQNNGQTDLFLSKFDFNGQRLWSTYYGGEGSDQYGATALNQRSISCNENNVYLSGTTSSTTNIATPGAFQETPNVFSSFLVQFDNSGIRQWGTYTGDYQGTSSDSSVYTDASNNSYITGRTNTKNNISVPGAYQEQIAGSSDPNDGLLANYSDTFIVKFSPLGQKLWGTYYGGELTELSGSCLTYGNSFYLYGTTQSVDGIATPNSQQPAFDAGTNSFFDAGNAYLAKFTQTPLNTATNTIKNLALYPNPNNGDFNLKGDFNGIKNLTLAIYDSQGRIVFTEKPEYLQNDNLNITLHNRLASGVYLIKLYNSDIMESFKMIVD